MMEYNCTGIPDDNKYPTRVLRNNVTHAFPSSFSAMGNNTLLEDTISSIDIWITDAPGVPLFYIAHGSSDYFARHGENGAISQIPADAESRLVARGVTISQTGPKAYRGGYFQCMQPNRNTKFNSSDNKEHYVLSTPSAISNPSCTLDGVGGVYAVLTPTQPQWTKLFRFIDTSEPIYYINSSGTEVLLSTENGFYALPGEAPWHWSCVRYVPPTSFAINRATTAHNFNVNLPDQLWNLRLTVFTEIEWIADKNSAIDASMSDPAVIATLYAILEHHAPFYPASYNDFKRVMSKIKQTYAQYKPLIDVAAGYIPYGRNVRDVLDHLLLDGQENHPGYQAVWTN
jgi:hypothetical protein